MTLPADERPATARPRRRTRAAAVAGVLALVVVAVGGAVATGHLPGVSLREGPLEGGAAALTIPLRPGDTGVLWGALELENTSGSGVVLDSVEIGDNPDHVELLNEPYIWDDGRYDILKTGSIVAMQMPLPDRWKNLPPRREINGFVMGSGTHHGPAKIGETPPEDYEYDGPSPEVVIELAPPARVSTVSGLTVRYHRGWLAYEKTFDMSITVWRSRSG